MIKKMTEGSSSVNTAATNGGADFKATFTLLPHVLKIAKAIQAQQNDPPKQQAQIQTAVSNYSHTAFTLVLTG